ncbi:SMC2 [Cordylochernes scorpioides]|uniref:Structural maintenance of chromosomes protein n=1 Tax=Cordylochernes scorpioides TaxID=51811 RepID=A0ABY6K0E5_9ARAC|nr:SMC2 [Cordylochernes scorpioides]
MYIKSIILDGFKSYGRRTELTGFDPYFNALTGLNGSGKSNVLDAICFLMGISNLSQVRAGSLQDLVYKQGQAGVNRAIVSITFDNSDKSQSPAGYENHREITITRQVSNNGARNKYLINGVAAQNNKVNDLFCSVQMNVNNPHFLIMQGRVTKVLNMKPHEILSLLEEAAGTRLYETKKISAQRTVEKKESKLKELNQVMEEEISPTLKKLHGERKAYMEYTKMLREIEHHTKLQAAWSYVQATATVSSSQTSLDEINQAIADSKAKIAECKTRIASIKEEIAALEKRKGEELGSSLKGLEEKLKAKQLEETRANSDMKYRQDCLKEERSKMKELQRNLDEDSKLSHKREKELIKFQDQVQLLEEASRTDAAAAKQAMKTFQAVSSGMATAGDSGETATLSEQLLGAKNDLARAETEMKQTEMKLQHHRAELKKKKDESKKTEQSFGKDQARFSAVEKEIDQLKKALDKMPYKEGQLEALQNEHRVLKNEIRQLTDKIDTFQARHPNLTFDYKSPTPNFDRKKVKGLVCTLLKLRDPSTATAIEVTGGGRLYNVVVDNEQTGKQLLNQGQLKRRVTIIPLNKIKGYPIDRNIVHNAENLVGKENVNPALSLIEYEREMEPAMTYVFGNTLVCPDMDTARSLTFNPRVSKRTVTLEGEVFDPVGSLSGGHRDTQRGSLLLTLADHVNNMEQLQLKSARLQQVSREMEQVSKHRESYQAQKNKLDLRVSELEQYRTTLQQTPHYQLLEEVRALEDSIQQQTELQQAARDTKAAAQQRAAKIESQIQNYEKHREEELRKAEKAMTDARKNAEKSAQALEAKREEMESARLELEDLVKAAEGYTEQLMTAEENVEGYQQQVARNSGNLERLKVEVAEAAAAVKQKKAELKSNDEELRKLHKQMEEMGRTCEENNLLIKQKEHDSSRIQSEAKLARQRVRQLETEHEWIEAEKASFGVPNTQYDFKQHKPTESAAALQRLQETKKETSKTINMRAHSMMGKAENQYQDLLEKKRIVEDDKVKIGLVIQDLDKKKKEALAVAWEKVNKDFGSIFSTLLPGTNAKLVEPEGQDFLQGLEIRVAFGNVWKQSLSELSGGQKSLVALSLILALLLFKPAPIYILDEVDAALDLSHTQNIGAIIKNHFNKSQFVIVSLKEGMFNNANVLFRTKFVEGMSTVSRHTPGNK